MSSKRTYLRFTLRLFFGLVSVIALLIALVAHHVNQVRIGHDVLSELGIGRFDRVELPTIPAQDFTTVTVLFGPSDSSGPSVASVTMLTKPAWLKLLTKISPIACSNEIVELQVYGQAFTDEMLLALKDIPTLRSLVIHNSKATSPGLRRFLEDSNIEFVRIGDDNKAIGEKLREVVRQRNGAHDYVVRETEDVSSTIAFSPAPTQGTQTMSIPMSPSTKNDAR